MSGAGKLDARLAALADAVELADGRLDPGRVDAARTVVRRAGERLGLGVDATVVALAGPTGAGKSTLFNLLAGAELARAGRRRPTTSAAAAAVWGDAGGALLDWLEVPRRHRLEGGELDGLVLLDLPDFDSVEFGHRLEVDRLVELVDLLVWVADPQKYADAVLHDRYLRPLAGHGGSMVVVLNQADLLPDGALAAARADLERLLREDGLDGVPVLIASATTGQGVAELRAELAERVAARAAAVERLAADVTSATAALAEQCGGRADAAVSRAARERLLGALAEAGGVPTVVRAVADAHRRRGVLAAGWPFGRWLRRLRPDPLRRLRLGDGPHAEVRTSLPGPSPVQRAQVEAAARALAADAARGLSGRWPGLVRSAAVAAQAQVPDRLDRAVAGADLRLGEPRWWRIAGLMQRLLAAAVLAGAAWLLALAVLGYLHVDELVPLPRIGEVPVPTVLLLGGIAAGLLLGLLARLVNGAGAARRAARAQRTLAGRVERVGDELVVGPVEAELAAYERMRERLAAAAGGAPGRSRGRRALASIGVRSMGPASGA